ncbi:uncharacterized protein [Triticum aestivum]|uniref:uncharacterized protein n=1 Tax=Triticum aestivum TaxID=4565 RepID=UPI001D007865|nr:uncharacterized protein LOC123099841 [Triticum aestivum]
MPPGNPWGCHKPARDLMSIQCRATPQVTRVGAESTGPELPSDAAGPSGAPASSLGTEQIPGRALELARSRGAIRLGFLQCAWGEMDRLEAELGDVYTHLEAKDQRLALECRGLEVAVNFSHLQHEGTHAKDEASTIVAKEARDRTFVEAEDADRRREAAERREHELLASIASLERQAREHGVMALAPTRGSSSREEEIRAVGEALELVASEQELELDQLEAMERQVMTAEAVLALEASVQEEANERVAEVRCALS